MNLNRSLVDPNFLPDSFIKTSILIGFNSGEVYYLVATNTVQNSLKPCFSLYQHK
jgi:hypothetical protein